MAVQILDSNGTNKLNIDAQGSLKSTPYHPNIASNGAYRLAAQTGLITGIAAASATAGHLFAARWGHATKLCIITKITMKWDTITGFTAAQELGLDCSVVRAYSASHTGGTQITLTGNSQKKRASHASSNFTDMRIATTTALTAGTHTFDPQPIIIENCKEMAAAATVQNNSFIGTFFPGDIAQHPLILSQNEGIVIRNAVTMGAAGTARVVVQLDWLEVDSY